MAALLLILACAAAIVQSPAHDRLRERIRKYGTLELRVQREFSPVEFPDLVSRAELIVRGLIVDQNSHLEPDETIWTDVRVQVLETLGGASEHVVQPGNIVVLRRPGGSITIDGQVVKSVENDFPTFDDGAEYVLFLRRESGAEFYVPVSGAQGVFGIETQHVRQMSQKFGVWNDLHKEMALSTFVDKIRKHRRSRRGI